MIRGRSRTSMIAVLFTLGILSLAGALPAIAAAASPGAAGDGPTAAPTPAPSAKQTPSGESRGGLSLAKAVVLGVVEGVTEYLPVSSTGHLLLTSHALGLADTEGDKQAADAYAIVIQFGAILAVLVLYASRIWSILRGIAGRDPDGLRVGLSLVASVVPAVIIGVLGEQYLKDYLFALWPIAAAWLAGGLVILAVARSDDKHGRSSADGTPLEELTVRRALVIGLLQCIAMWPGVSRSLATILGGDWWGSARGRPSSTASSSALSR